MHLPDPTMHVIANGRLAFSRIPYTNHSPLITCDANGSMQREVNLPPNVSWIWKTIPKSIGNLVVVSGYPTKLIEIDPNGTIIRQYMYMPAL